MKFMQRNNINLSRIMEIFIKIFKILPFIFFLAFAWWLMSHTFGSESNTHFIFINGKLWSDFGAQIPLIRSFSLGGNWDKLIAGLPIELPGFPGVPIRYHFGFYALVGILERFGVPLGLALNIPSALGFGLMLSGIYVLANRIFKNKFVAIMSVVFMLFNGTLAFLKFFAKYPLSLNTLTDILTNRNFPAFGPWDGGPVTAFWNLNIYTNQRHLGLSFGLTLVIILMVLNNDHPQKFIRHLIKAVMISLLMDILLIINQPAAAIAVLFLAWFIFTIPASKLSTMIAGLLSIPWFLHLNHISASPGGFAFHPFYLINDPVTILSFLNFWWYNLGLHLILIPLGFILAPRKIKLLLFFPLIILFIIPNLFQFSPDMINNHKFFNFFMIIGNFFTAFFIFKLIRLIRHIRLIYLQIPLYLAPLVLVFFLTFSGMIDFSAVAYDERGGIWDIRTDQVATWIYENTPPGAIFLNSTWLYHPASIAGRFVFSGYPYFTWSYGYNKDAREEIVKNIYGASSVSAACYYLHQNHITYVELNDHPDEYFKTNWPLWKNDFKPIYRNTDRQITIYKVSDTCPNL
jgi:hypothetical protein